MPITSIQHTMESFFLCSHLPICAIDPDSNLMLATGLSAQLSSYIKSTNIKDTNIKELKGNEGHHTASFFKEMAHLAKKHRTQLEKESHYIYSPQEGLHFMLCPILPQDLSQGLYIIGPYTSDPALKEDYLFKPAHCIAPLAQLLYAFDPPASSCSAIESQPECSYHIHKAKDYIDQHYREMITLDQLAQHLNLNKSYLCTLFKKVENDSFCHYTNKVRIEKSKQLLLDTTDSILDIGLAVGFSSGSYYTTLFKKIAGLTPVEYRKQFARQESGLTSTFLPLGNPRFPSAPAKSMPAEHLP